MCENPEKHPVPDRYRYIKSQPVTDGILQGTGYALGGEESILGQEVRFSFSLAESSSFHFVFGFRGVGNHYRVTIDATMQRVVLNRLEDGMLIYLQHAYLDQCNMKDFEIRWNSKSIRLFNRGVCFLNVLSGSIEGGHWGFAGMRKPVKLPEVTVSHHPTPQYDWIILGDGYSNNRWKNRDFQSWPELAFGDKCLYLNACVAAGNTRRTLEIARSLGSAFQDAGVIVAAGSDDFMENEPHEDIVARLLEIDTLARAAGATSTHLCSLTPRGNGNQYITSLNAMLEKAAANHFDSVIDLHHILCGHFEKWIIDGDYPGAEAQREIARHVLLHLGMDDTLAPLSTFAPSPPLRGNCARAASKLVAMLTRGLGGF
jgi:hypothetical protein